MKSIKSKPITKYQNKSKITNKREKNNVKERSKFKIKERINRVRQKEDRTMKGKGKASLENIVSKNAKKSDDYSDLSGTGSTTTLNNDKFRR